MGNGSSKTSKTASKSNTNAGSKEMTGTKRAENDPHGLFTEELKSTFDFSHIYKDPYIPLFLVQAHSTEPESTFVLPKGIDILHYCKKRCILRTKRIKKNSPAKARNNSELNTDFRSISMEYACLKRLEIYDRYETQCPQYEFSIDEAIKKEGGIYICLDKEIRKIFTFEPGQIYSMESVVEFAKGSVTSTRIHIGILACRRAEGCTDVIVALPGSPSQHENTLNPERIHKPFSRTVNRNMEQAIKRLPKGFGILHRKYTKKRKQNSR